MDQRLDQIEAPAEAAPGDPVAEALATALGAAASAGQWSVVETLARELAARHSARVAQPAGVIDFGDEKLRRRR